MRHTFILIRFVVGISLFAECLKAGSEDEESPSFEITYTRRTSEKPFSAKVEFPDKDLTVNMRRERYVLDRSKEKLIHLSSDVWKVIPGGVYIPKLYAALRCFTGPCDENYDPFKGSFAFLFVLDVNKAGVTTRYVHWLYQCRSLIEGKVNQIVPLSDPRGPSVLHEPEGNMLSRSEACDFSRAIYTYLVEEMDRIGHAPKPFVLPVPSNHLVSGFVGRYFSEYWKTLPVYEARVAELLDYVKKFEEGYRIGKLEAALECFEEGVYTEEIIMSKIGVSSEQARIELSDLQRGEKLEKESSDTPASTASEQRTAEEDQKVSETETHPAPKRRKLDRAVEKEIESGVAKLLIPLRYISEKIIDEKTFVEECGMPSEEVRRRLEEAREK